MGAVSGVVAVAAVLLTAGCDLASNVDSLSNEVGPCPVGVQTTPGTCDVHVKACNPPGSCPPSPDGTPSNAFATLQAAHDAMPSMFDENWVVYVHEGTYWQAQVAWSKTDPNYTVEIRPAGNDKPVFDGRSSPSDPTGIAKFFGLEKPGPTNLTLRGLTIQHYYAHGVTIDNCADFGGCGDCDVATTGNNQVINNLIQYIGTQQDPACENHGYSALGINSSENNTVAGNQFVHLENLSEPQGPVGGKYDADFDLIHAVYLAHRASNNTIRDNFVDLCTGAPFKVRDACNGNRFERNHVNRSGYNHVVNAWHGNGECPSHGNVFNDNVVTFPYPMYPDSKETLSPRVLQPCGGAGIPSCNPVGEFSESGNVMYRVEPESELLRAIATGNTGLGATDEVYVALEYENPDPDPQPPFTKIVSTGRSPWLSELVYHSTSRTVTAMVAGNFDGTGNPELVTAFEEAGTTKVYRGSGVSQLPGITGATDLGLVYSDADWDLTALAAGDLNGNGSDELFTGLVRPCCKRIYRGNGITSLTTWGNLLDTDEVPVALAVGNFDGTGAPELISVLDDTTGTRIVRGTGVGTGGADNLGEIADSSSAPDVRSVTGQDAERDGDDELQSGSHGSTNRRIYRGNGSTSATTATLYNSPSTYWTIPALARRTGPSTNHLVSGFQAADAEETQIWSGDGSTSASNVAEHYKSIFDGAPNPEDVPFRMCPPPGSGSCNPPPPVCP